MSPPAVALISALGGVLIGTLGNVIIAVVTKRTEHRRELKRLIVTSGIEQWKESISAARANRVIETEIIPVAAFILQNSMIMDLVGDENITEEKVKAVVEKARKIRRVFEDASRR